MKKKLKFSSNGNGNGYTQTPNLFSRTRNIVYDTTPPTRIIVEAKNENQQKYLDCIRKCDITFVIGPAGVGKSFLSSAIASKMLRAGEVERIVCIRPGVTAGENLGFLPGTIEDKISPYLRPFIDHLNKFFSPEEMKKYRRGDPPVIELMPIAYMRGCEFENSIVVVDEGQNLTYNQLWLILTRLGQNSKIVINGDTSQCDLKPSDRGALEYYSNLFQDFPEVGLVTMDESDSVRHPLVTKMMKRKLNAEKK